MNKLRPILVTDTGEHFPRLSGETTAVFNNRTFNIRLAMRSAREAMGDVARGDKFETISYPSLGAVLVRRV